MLELLSPAGNFEKMKSAIRYGADAVYLAGHFFGMRSAADNFTNEELKDAVIYAHERGVKVYLTVNTMPHGYEYERLREYLISIKDFGIDAIIAADLGVIATIKELLPEMEIHVSTQASIVSPAAALAYVALGAKRLVLARELTLEEIKEIKKAIPEDVELEAFVHGSMCVSYSGRCMLSHHIIGRDANRGACAQPCRWNYKIVEEKRPDMPLPIEENELGTFIMSSKDMCTIEILPELIGAGINSFKIEGRMKSAYYTAVVTNAYRMAIDAYLANPENYKFDERLYTELESVSHREYCTGYYLDEPIDEAQLTSDVGYIRDKAYFATAVEYSLNDIPKNLEVENENGRLALFMQKNKVSVGDGAEVISPGYIGRALTVTELYDDKGEPIESAPHPFMRFWVRAPFEVKEGDIMRSAER
ncbi:MAG: U32 family peptidase [Clostridia bacterium]|nr:U32 family peptidase [Clostridia bacterium]